MVIYFDRKTLSILRYIHRRGSRGATWGQLYKKFGEDAANPYLLESLSTELYTATKGHDGKWLSFDAHWDKIVYDDFRSYCTPKGNELLEKRLFDFWKWVIPTLISVVALCFSFIGLLK